MTQRRVLIRDGSIVSMDPEVEDLTGDVRIDGDRITAIGPGVSVDDAEVEVIDASGHIVVPFDVPFAHLWRARDGKLVWLQQYIDTAVLRNAIEGHTIAGTAN